jgi:RHS repeat-associated protein
VRSMAAQTTETGLDYFEARYMSSPQGRFTSPDPVFASAARVMDPQQWNMFAYARKQSAFEHRSDRAGLQSNVQSEQRNDIRGRSTRTDEHGRKRKQRVHSHGNHHAR